MAKIVSVNHTRYGKTELNVERVIAVVPEKNMLLFEDVYWVLSEEDFDKVYEEWKEL
jgi:hypothetical protein